MPSSIKRSVQIKVTLSSDVHARLGQLAARLGQPPATLCSVWIGQHVSQLEAGLGATERMVQTMTDKLEPHLVEQLRLSAALASEEGKP